MPMTDHKKRETEAVELLSDLIARAERAGAEGADAVFIAGASLSVAQRLGKREELERAESQDLGLRVFIGKQQAIVSSSDTAEPALDELVERALAMARSAPEDPHCGLADDDLLAAGLPNLDLLDAIEPEADELFERAAYAEDAARAVPGITNSEGAGASWGASTVALVASNGFAGAYSSSRHSVSASVLAGEGTAMQRDYEFSSSRFVADLEDAATIGRQAGERAVKRLDPRRVASVKVPIVFEPRVATSLLRHLAGAIAGPAVARGTSFLKDGMDKPVFAPGVSVIDDPHRRRGLASRPCDGEGVRTERHAVIDDGRLTTWLLDTSSAHQLGLKSTGHASRGTSSPPSPAPANFYLEAGGASPENLMADIREGFYVTELIGFGVNAVTGDYSRGASGFWIEDGVTTYPVSEVTIAGNLKEMFAALTPADDLEFRRGVDSPTVRIEGVTVAGT